MAAKQKKHRLRTRAAFATPLADLGFFPLGPDEVCDLRNTPIQQAFLKRIEWQQEQEILHLRHATKVAQRALREALWNLHEAVEQTKAEIIAQFGPDSPEARKASSVQLPKARPITRLRARPGRPINQR